MSDIDRTRMIPLHIADQAVAACDAEIAKLREENASLKADVERLTKHDDDTCRHFIMRTLLEAQNDFLNARVERLTKAGDAMAGDLLKEFGRKEMLKYQPYQDWLAAKEGKTK
jgi:cell division protein FtsB